MPLSFNDSLDNNSNNLSTFNINCHAILYEVVVACRPMFNCNTLKTAFSRSVMLSVVQ